MVLLSEADIFGAAVKSGVAKPMCSNASSARSQWIWTLTRVNFTVIKLDKALQLPIVMICLMFDLKRIVLLVLSAPVAIDEHTCTVDHFYVSANTLNVTIGTTARGSFDWLLLNKGLVLAEVALEKA